MAADLSVQSLRPQSLRPQSPRPSVLRRLLHLWALYARMDLIWIARDLKMCLLWILSDSILGIATVTGIWLLSERFSGIGVWTRPQIIFLLGYATTVGSLIDMFFNYNVAFVSRRLGRGQFDHTLIQPQPLWLSLLTEGFAPFSGGILLLPGLCLLVWSAHTLSLTISPLWLLLLGLYLFCSLTIVLAFQFLWGSLAFWAPRSAEEISTSTANLINSLKSYPLDGLASLHTLLAGSLLTVLPVGFVAWYPCRILLGLYKESTYPWLPPFAALALAMLATLVFRQGLEHYLRVGSQRYSDRGHRG